MGSQRLMSKVTIITGPAWGIISLNAVIRYLTECVLVWATDTD